MPLSATPEMGRVVRLSTVACLVIAGLVLIAVTLAGHAVAGALVAAGVVIGAANAHLTQRLVGLGLPIAATSLARIMSLTSVACVVGLIGGFSRVFLVVVGVGIAQLLMAASALRELRR